MHSDLLQPRQVSGLFFLATVERVRGCLPVCTDLCYKLFYCRIIHLDVFSPTCMNSLGFMFIFYYQFVKKRQWERRLCVRGVLRLSSDSLILKKDLEVYYLNNKSQACHEK